jgi:hypothetical protein
MDIMLKIQHVIGLSVLASTVVAAVPTILGAPSWASAAVGLLSYLVTSGSGVIVIRMEELAQHRQD